MNYIYVCTCMCFTVCVFVSVCKMLEKEMQNKKHKRQNNFEIS